MADKKFKLPPPIPNFNIYPKGSPLNPSNPAGPQLIDPDEGDNQDIQPEDLLPGNGGTWNPGPGPQLINPDGPVFNPEPDPPDWGDWEWIRPYTELPPWWQNRWGTPGPGQGPGTIDPSNPLEETTFPNRPGYGERSLPKDFFPAHWSVPTN